jgi:hypothetical protein
VFLLEGALEKAQTEADKARLRSVVRIAKSKSTVLPSEAGYGTESVRDEIYRIVDILDPIDRVKLRPRIASIRDTRDKKSPVEEEDEEGEGEGEEEEEEEEEEQTLRKKKLKGKIHVCVQVLVGFVLLNTLQHVIAQRKPFQ